jgi:hypothetical protein
MCMLTYHSVGPDLSTSTESITESTPLSCAGTAKGNLVSLDPLRDIIPQKYFTDPVKRPAHYTAGEIETIDFIDQTVDSYTDSRLAHYVACALKYLARAPHKGALQQDLEKCEWYVRRAVNRAAEVSAQAQK